MQSQQQRLNKRYILVEEWETILHYWANDNSISWTRCSAFLLVNSILLSLLVLSSPDGILPIWFLRYVITPIAVVVNGMWWPVSFRSVAYIQYFYDHAAKISKQVPALCFMDDLNIKYYFSHWWLQVSGRTFLRVIPGLFLILWFVLLLYNLYLLIN